MDLTQKTVFICLKRTHGGLLSQWQLFDTATAYFDMPHLLSQEPADMQVFDLPASDATEHFKETAEKLFAGRLLDHNSYRKTVEITSLPLVEDLDAALGMLADGHEQVLVRGLLEVPEQYRPDQYGIRTLFLERFILRAVSYRVSLVDATAAGIRRFYRDKLRAFRRGKHPRRPRASLLPSHMLGRIINALYRALPRAMQSVLRLNGNAFVRQPILVAAFLHDMLRMARQQGIDPAPAIRRELDRRVDLKVTRRSWERLAKKHSWLSDRLGKALKVLPILAKHRRKPCRVNS